MTDNPRDELAHLAASLRRTVQLKKTRFLSGKKPNRLVAPTLTKKSAPLPPASPSSSLATFKDDPSLSKADRLVRLREHIGDCQRCPLGATRIQLAYGVGNPDARVVFVGEGPGYAEDRKGEPFVGPAGQLLDKILTATDLSRTPQEPAWKWVYIANMVKCHPLIDPSDNTKRSNDRPPTPEEMAVCSPFLMAQIRIIQPLFIVALGATAGKALLKTEEAVSKFRGKWVDFKVEGLPAPIRFLPTFHPAALLRNPALKIDVWEDMKNLKAALEAAVGPAT
jgi:uracil-DNA glycosylase family 4